MCEDVLQLLGAVGLVVLGAVLAALWDTQKAKRDRATRQRAALIGFREEMAANRSSAGNNRTLIAVEQQDLQKGGGALINPINLLEVGAWPIARIDLPKALLEDADLVKRLRQISTNTADINGIISSRENFRIAHMTDRPALVAGLESYARILSHLLKDLIDRIEEALPLLEEHLPET